MHFAIIFWEPNFTTVTIAACFPTKVSLRVLQLVAVGDIPCMEDINVESIKNKLFDEMRKE